MNDDSDNNEPQTARDAIPRDAVWLTDAYKFIVDLLGENPELLPEFDEHQSEALRKSRQVEQTVGHDPETFDKDLEEEWHLRKQVNLFLRSELENGGLTACVRDPRSSSILQLHSEGWIPREWDDYIPPGIWTDFVDGSYEEPGPSGTLIDGALRPVFFMRSEFQAWLKETFGAGVKLNGLPAPANPKEGARVRDAIVEAVRALWGKSPPAGLVAEKRNDAINNWLECNGRLKTSPATIRRALELMRRERT
jgi:hypothetical protein